jgi:hypothetical protein
VNTLTDGYLKVIVNTVTDGYLKVIVKLNGRNYELMLYYIILF